jgi:hypothetical protein
VIAVTIGTGRYAQLAQHAARAVQEMTGLQTVILNEEHFAASGLPTPHFLKLRLFELTDAESVLFFDADIICLKPWRPHEFASQDAIVAVADLLSIARGECRKWSIPLGEYINTGMMILNRASHQEWLRETEHFVKTHPPANLYDQTPLNIVRHQLGLRLELLDRRYNWLSFGYGSLCYQVPVFMAHRMMISSKVVNLDFFEGRCKPPFDWHIEINECETKKLRGQIVYLDAGFGKTCIFLKPDGTVGPSDSPAGGHYWFVRNEADQPTLTLASHAEILQEFHRAPDGCWETVLRLQPHSAQIASAMRDIVATRWFRYKRCGCEVQDIELLPGGEIGQGATQHEQFWYVLDDTTDITLVLGAERRETCRISWDPDRRYGEGRQLLPGNARVKISSCY